MGTVAKKEIGGNFEPTSEGLHTATCIAVVDLGEQYSKQYGNYHHKVLITFEIHDETITIDGEEKPRVISNTYTLSLGEKANLRGDLESWRGKKFTDAELDGFDVKNVLGAHCQVNVAHTTKDGKTYANIMSIVPWPRGMAAPEVVSEKIYYDMDDPGRDEVIARLPEWIQKRIKESRTYENEPLRGRVNNEPV